MPSRPRFAWLFTAVLVLALTVSGPARASERPANASAPYLPPPPGVNTRIILKRTELARGRFQLPASRSLLNTMSAAADVNPILLHTLGGYERYDLGKALTPAEYADLITSLSALPGVRSVEQEYFVYPDELPDDFNPDQLHFLAAPGQLDNSLDTFGIDAVAAWDLSTGDPHQYIAVLDTGIFEHPDLDGRWIGGYDFVSDEVSSGDGDGWDSDPRDSAYLIDYKGSSWHGLHVAGTIAARANNGQGIVGVDWQSMLVPVRVLGAYGGGLYDVMAGMEWAAGLPVEDLPLNPHPVRVINLSLGGPVSDCPGYLQESINRVVQAGAVVVAAAGNNNIDAAGFIPASCAGVITVAASNATTSFDKASFSNYGATIEISAPGTNIYSTVFESRFSVDYPTYEYKAGTSMAAPLVSGAVSLMLSLRPDLTPQMVSQILQASARPFPESSWCVQQNACGAGLLDVYAALQAALAYQAIPTVTPTLSPSPTPTATPKPPAAPQASLEQAVLQGAQLRLYGQHFQADEVYAVSANGIGLGIAAVVSPQQLAMQAGDLRGGEVITVHSDQQGLLPGALVLNMHGFDLFLPLVVR